VDKASSARLLDYLVDVVDLELVGGHGFPL